MGFMDKLKKGAQAPADDDEAAPSGPTVSGSLRGNGAAMATVLKKNNIIAAAVIGAVVIMAGAYYAYDLSTGPSTTHAGGTVEPVTTVADIRVPHIKAPVADTVSVPAVASTDSVPAIQPSGNGAVVPAQGAAPSQPAIPAQPTPQMLALQSAVDGEGSTVSWQTASSSGTPGTQTGTPATVATILPKPKTSVYSTHLVRKEASPYELTQGTVIPATLETGIKSDLPGEITAVVSQPVYNSVSGAYVLIPAGSKLVGTYQSKIMAGATRVGVAWTRILFPNGTYLQIGGMPGADASGYAGFHDLVNDHTWTVFKNALLLSLIDVGMAVASPTSAMTTTGAMTGNTALQDGEQSLAQTFGQAEAQLMQKAINIAPTITIRPGYAFNVMVMKDLVFPGPYQHGNQIAPVAPASAAAPTIANPYN
ncbi:TrbI/VirB10 family protein [Acidithiobacillus ferrooxidans]|uniref:Conjugal transfer protein TrbI n=1 Tax=Acidithiobacillus ferrooxidans TaxID=920 RepID=A0A2W1K603_ACIFR|nr:TrbI/VirB10 family protein [Acidithiobacillus ferrooxidans]MBU2816335.1 conjugal transfer protein TrbI [Acidithiobacillus ferrooxidans]MCR1343999.1 conjugal transfer protein TrbI [Acidithiobacillus ferrooxidans]PZD82378.1 conjugal transfer protein TrbI [Acidithiobacillus ferrooxidans]QLK41348.1 conjugal transfer protein TrbI [Acidithiobacillus ferrooxidans]QZT53290.1 conjugal transfer protein TrbI [Acidithiobacillus ferrooxidans]